MRAREDALDAGIIQPEHALEPVKILLDCDFDHTKVHRTVLFSAHENGSNGYDQIVHPQRTSLHRCHRGAGLRSGFPYVRVDAPEAVSK
jgi:hypothetical protein